MKTDIRNRKDIEKLVNAFYDKIKIDAVIGYLFNDVVHTNWHKHISVMYDFWENILFFKGNYIGNPMEVHKELHKRSSIKAEHYEHWNLLFLETVDKLFTGQKAEEIKKRALNISAVLQNNTLS